MEHVALCGALCGALLGHCWGTVLFLETVHIWKVYRLNSKAAASREQVCAAGAGMPMASPLRWGFGCVINDTGRPSSPYNKSSMSTCAT